MPFCIAHLDLCPESGLKNHHKFLGRKLLRFVELGLEWGEGWWWKERQKILARPWIWPFTSPFLPRSYWLTVSPVLKEGKGFFKGSIANSVVVILDSCKHCLNGVETQAGYHHGEQAPSGKRVMSFCIILLRGAHWHTWSPCSWDKEQPASSVQFIAAVSTTLAGGTTKALSTTGGPGHLPVSSCSDFL